MSDCSTPAGGGNAGEMRTLAILTLLSLATVAVGAEPGTRRLGPPATIQSDEPEMGEEGEGAEPEVPDGDDGFDDGRDDGRDVAPVPHGPAMREPPPSSPSAPRGEEEEPAAPPEGAPSSPGPAEPASAVEPASPE
jgi:hypothetical protein